MNRVLGTPRYAHAEGHTDICFSEDGEFIITCGSDGDVRMYKGIEDDDVPAKCVGEKAFAVVQKDGKLYVGSDHNYVQILTFPEGDLDGILTRFTAPVNTIDVCKDGTLVAAGSSDSEIHVVDLSTKIVKHFCGHKAPILKVSFDPKKEFIASSSCDGTVRIWKIEDQTIVKEWSDVIKSCNSFHSSESLCCISWEPLTGRLLAIPFTNEIKLIQRSTWNVMTTLCDPVSQDFSLTAWSSCGRFLAASTLKGRVFVWNTLINKLVSSYSDKSEVNICALQWHPSSDARQIAFCDVQGQLSMLENCYPTAKTISSNSSINDQFKKSVNEETNGEDWRGVDDDDDDPNVVSLEKIKSDYSYLDDETGSAKNHNREDDEDSRSVKSSISRYEGRPMLMADLQLPFQPTSTPVHLQRRFMVFNDIGYARHTNTEEENMIDVDFHDASLHHSFRINNLLNHTLAALNSEALVLACEKTEDSTSKLVCRVFKSWDSTKEWNIEMSPNESIEAIAVGLKWIAIITSLRLLRLFSLSGVQREIICLSGPIVSINAFEDLLIVVYHSATGLPDEQNLCFAVYQITYDVKVLVAAQPLPLMPKSTLKWVGFSDQSNPCILDSDGALKLFSSTSGLWKPISFVDSQAKDLSDHYFVIGVSEERQNIRCILCKGSYYPSTTPHPFITEIPWQIPVCDLSMDKGVLEEKFWRCSIAKECLLKEDPKLNTEFKATALKLFALSCRTNHEMRVFELCDLANQADIIELALKYASKMNNDLLVQKLSELQSEQKTRSEVTDDSFELNKRHGDDYFKYRGYESHVNNDGENYGRRYTNGGSQSQELFPDNSSMNPVSKLSQEIDTCSSEPSINGTAHSLIAETKKKRSTNEQRATLPSRKINPFRKPVAREVTPNSNSFAPPTGDGDISGCIASYKEENLNLPFKEWFKVERNTLTQEFPGIEETDLAREAIKKFRSLKSSGANRTNSSTCSSSEIDDEVMTEESTVNVGNKKRKSLEDSSSPNCEGNDDGVKKMKPLLKLQNFKFTKKN